MLQLSDVPIMQAPMAGGPSTPALTAAVNDAGGYGFLAGGYLSADDLRAQVASTRSLTGAAFGVNLFMPSAPGDRSEVSAYASLLQPEAERLGVELGHPVWDDDAYEEKLGVVEEVCPHMVSFTFGCPAELVVERLHRANCQVAVTVTSVAEARVAAAVGADILAVQGTEAGGHQGAFLDLAANHRTLLSLLEEIHGASDLPLIGTGGIMTGTAAAAALNAGAFAVQLGTAFLCTPEAGTSTTYRQALLECRYADTMVTRAYSGRFARGLANEFAQNYDQVAPQAYPEVHHLTRPLRAAATKAGDPSVPNLWAGTGWRHVSTDPAANVVRAIAAGIKGAM
jgi:nitronate monooxygenase